MTFLQEAVWILQVAVSHRRKQIQTYSGESESESENALLKGKRVEQQSARLQVHQATRFYFVMWTGRLMFAVIDAPDIEVTIKTTAVRWRPSRRRHWWRRFITLPITRTCHVIWRLFLRTCSRDTSSLSSEIFSFRLCKCAARVWSSSIIQPTDADI